MDRLRPRAPPLSSLARIHPRAACRELLMADRSEADIAANNAVFNADARDTSTPVAMAELLRRIWDRELLSEASSALLIDIMYRCRTGEGRLKGVLPPGTRVAHKTGTIGQTTNDVGIIDVPGDAGHVVAVVYIKESEVESYADREPVIAHIARAIHDYFRVQSGVGDVGPRVLAGTGGCSGDHAWRGRRRSHGSWVHGTVPEKAMRNWAAFTSWSRFAPSLVVAVAACGGSTMTPEPDPVEPSRPVPCTFPNATCAERVEIADGLFLPVYSTHLLSEGHEGVTRGLIVIHGNNRDADTYFETGVLAAVEAGVSGATAIVAPHFQTSDDDPEADEPFWSSAGWKRGNLSRPEGPSPRVNSYTGLDRIVDAFLTSSRFPAMREIVVAGHSAGGQVVHRYAATTEHRATDSGVAFRYVVTNPSTYLYLGPEREDAEGGFVVPDTGCEDYDEWHYGLQDRNNYADRLEADSIRAQLARHDVRILLGDADTTAASLDVSCGADLQGLHRYHRGRTLVRFMDAMYAGHAHREMIVPGVGHSSRSMWLSEVGAGVLFGN